MTAFKPGLLRIIFFLLLLLRYELGFAMDSFLMGHDGIGLTTMYLYMWKEKGFFAKEEIDLKLVKIPVSTAPGALIANQLDGMAYGPIGVLLRNRGAPLVPVFFHTQKPGWLLMSNPSITGIGQLSKKTLSVGALGAAPQKMTIDLLRKNGVDPNSVTFIVSRGGTQERLKMLLGGVIDAANLNPPNNFIAERAGFRTLFAYGDYFELAQNGLVVNDTTLRERRPFLKRVVRAFLNSHLSMQEHKDETVKWMVNKLKIETRDAEKTFDLIVKAITPYGVATQKAVQNSLSDQAQNSAKSDLVDYGVLQEILKERGLKTD